MPWARIDDAFDDHPKVLAVLEHEQGVAAIGLWALCLTWAYRNTLKRGKVRGGLPAHLPRRYAGPSARELAALLVKEDLWEPLPEGDGWQIHDFEEYLATPKTREARSEAGKKGAASRWAGHDRKPAGPDGSLPGSDGNLPSGDGKGMAPDGRSGSGAGSRPGSGTKATRTTPPDGNESSEGGNLPSGLPFDDDKPMASDGSRAPARRAIPNGIASRDPSPVPGPVQQPATPSAAADEPRLTITQRSKRITDAYAEAEPLCKWPAVNGVVIRAIKTEKYADDEIRDALLRMAAENRSVTVDSLRTELGGLPPAKGRQNSASGPDRARGWMAAGRKVQQDIDNSGRELPA